MFSPVKIILAILTLITFLAVLFFAVLGLFIHQPILTVTCLCLDMVFGYFVYLDGLYFFGKKK